MLVQSNRRTEWQGLDKSACTIMFRFSQCNVSNEMDRNEIGFNRSSIMIEIIMRKFAWNLKYRCKSSKVKFEVNDLYEYCTHTGLRSRKNELCHAE